MSASRALMKDDERQSHWIMIATLCLMAMMYHAVRAGHPSLPGAD
jgi:hypothetical protein